MSLVTLAQLVTPVQQADALALELSEATTLGLQTSAWNPLDPSRTILQINANIIAQWSQTVNLTAQGGYASYAAQMVDQNGAPITSWMDLICFNNYNLIRFQATNATGPVPVTVAGGSPALTWSSNSPVRFQNPNPPNATYTSSGSGTISPGASGTVTVNADAAFVGTAGTATIGTVLTMLTPRSGVTVNALTSNLTGTAQESNAALLQRCVAKLGSLSSLTVLQANAPNPVTPVPIAPGGASGSYYYVATSIPVGVVSSVWPYYVSAQITRCGVVSNPYTGLVQVYLANASGPAPSGDVTVINAAIQALCVPQAVTCTVQAAGQLSITITCNVWIKLSAGITQTQASTNITNALITLFHTIPIGGYAINGGVVPVALLEDTIFDANPGTVDVVMVTPSSDTPITSSQVAVLNGTPTVTVTLV